MKNAQRTYASDGIDCHIHIFGSAEAYPAIAEKTYTPSETTFDQWRFISEPYGIRRAVVVQPSVYGFDNSKLLDALAQTGRQARGVAVVGQSVPADSLEAMHSLGVRGVRLNLATGASPDVRTALARLKAIAERIAEFGWHIQVLARGTLLEAVAGIVPSLPVTIIFDHMAGARSRGDADQQGFRSALELLRAGKCWMKISGADHVASRREAPEEALPIMRKLVDANPDQLIWGSDWPHVGKAKGAEDVDYLAIDHGTLLELLYEAAGPVNTRRILQDNPEKFYDWQRRKQALV